MYGPMNEMLQVKKKETRQKFSVRKEKLCLSSMDSFKNKHMTRKKSVKMTLF